MYPSAPVTTHRNRPGSSSLIFVLDMNRDDARILSHQSIWADPALVPCVFPQWLGSSQIPSSAGCHLLVYSCCFTSSQFYFQLRMCTST
jgi:hypothetical protein